jgi:hypothetical protein
MPRSSSKTASTPRKVRERPIATTQGGQPLAAITRATGAMVRAGSDVQQHIAQSTGVLQQEAARKLRLATNPAEFFAVQAAFMLASWQQSVECTGIMAQAWQDALRAPRSMH